MPAIETTHMLLVEDSEDDLFFFRRLLAKAGIKSPLAIATDGQQAVDHLSHALSRDDGAASPALPRLIFLDLKLPLRSGFEVLEWIRGEPALAGVVVIVLSSSAEARDVAQAFQLGAQGYLVKYPEPPILQELVAKVSALPADADLSGVTFPSLPRP